MPTECETMPLAGHLSEGVRSRVLRAVHGDARAAAETLGLLTDRQRNGVDPLPSEPSELAPARLRELRRRISRLPADTRRLVLLAACDQYPVATNAFSRAVVAAGMDSRAVAPAEAADLAHHSATGITFHDRWACIAVYEGASVVDRREAHCLLARVLHHDSEAPERAWHRGAAALGPSKRLAAELEAAAHTARRHRRHTLACALLERAAALHPDHGSSATLLGEAATDAWHAGDSDRARRLARAGGDTAMLGVLALRGGDAGEAFEDLLSAAAGCAERDPERAAHLLARATEALVYSGDLRRCREAVEVALRCRLTPPGTLTGLAAAAEGDYDGARRALQSAPRRGAPQQDPILLIHDGVAAMLLGDPVRARSATMRAAAAARIRNDGAALPQALEFRSYAEFWCSRPQATEAAVREALRQAQESGQDSGACHLRAALAMCAAIRGDRETCQSQAEAATEYALPRGLGLASALSFWAQAFLDLGAGLPAAAVARLRALISNGHPVIRHLATPHYVEAAVRTGDTALAHHALDFYERWVDAVGSDTHRALVARCRALLAAGPEADAYFRTALDLHTTGVQDFERARTELFFGSALRRSRRRAEARDRLLSALQSLEHFGAPQWAAQARAELRSLGEAALPRTAVGEQDDLTQRLTPQQLVIARMAAEGATNREIAAQLLLSPRTIDHHLRGVFTRLDIRSRIELARVLLPRDA
ncbi:helix-turn-helix transcriptional regulator [Streptomyces actuosus]|uniref:Helix-turn-helix transcriptional regulator n=1 Tax=Streptomyces actuosus TaxID=1885 RepID=A0ABS2VIX3_STRAS|nr:helix-turn-helix transcriptional regulator [Streptomyces actuosus]MBN0043040.1 helix-turn-helix transcriptional regulator [Streptomyces actuosus]